MEKNELSIILGFFLMVLGGIVYIYVPIQYSIASDVLVFIGFSIILYILDFSTVKSTLIALLLTLIAVGSTVLLIAIFYKTVPFLREHKTVFVVTVGMVLPRAVAAIMRQLLGIEKPDV